MRFLCSLNLSMGQNTSGIISFEVFKPVLQKLSLDDRAGDQKGGEKTVLMLTSTPRHND